MLCARVLGLLLALTFGMDHASVLQKVPAGLAAGFVATAAMSSLMLAARRVGLMGKLPPEKITDKALKAVGLRTSKRTAKGLSMTAHFAYGMTSGALFAGVIRGKVLRNHPVVEALAFTALVYVASYVGWIPALGIMPPPQRDRPGRPASMWLAHLVYGTVLGTLTARAQLARAPRQDGE
jgi:hypothetical protein